MKKRKMTFALSILLIVCPVIQSQESVSKLFSGFSKAEGVERVNLGKMVMSFARLFEDVMGVDGIEVLSFSNCSETVKNDLSRAVRSLKDEAYETLVSVNEENEKTKILVKLKNEQIRELVVLQTGNDPSLVRIKGKIKKSDIERIVNKN